MRWREPWTCDCTKANERIRKLEESVACLTHFDDQDVAALFGRNCHELLEARELFKSYIPISIQLKRANEEAAKLQRKEREASAPGQWGTGPHDRVEKTAARQDTGLSRSS